MEEAPGKKMGWTEAWRIANVTATSTNTLGLRRLTNKQTKKSEARHFLPQAVVESGSGDRGESGVGTGWGSGPMFTVVLYTVPKGWTISPLFTRTDAGNSCVSCGFSLAVSMLFLNGEGAHKLCILRGWSFLQRENAPHMDRCQQRK